MGRTKRKRQQRNHIPTAGNNFIPSLYSHLRQFGWQNTTELSVLNFAHTGRGLCSKTRSFNENDELIRLPFSCLLTINTLEADLDFRSQFDDDKFDKDNRVSFQALMAFYLLYQKNQKEASNIFYYLQTLPEHFTTPYFCTMDELQCLPDELLEKIVEQNRKLRECHQLLYNLLREEYKQNTIYHLDAFKWAYFVVNTRSVYMRSSLVKPHKCYFGPALSDAPNLALAPFLDLFNHSTDVTTKAELVHSEQTSQWEFIVTLSSTAKLIPRYAQLFISYGVLTNFKLLLDYGFFLANNCHDYFEFSLRDIEHFIKFEKSFGTTFAVHRNKFKFIREHNLDDQMFMHPQDGMSHNLHVVLHLIFKESSHFSNVLNQVAFGDVTQLADVTSELRLFLAFKMVEYQGFLVNLSKLRTLSPSALVVKNYVHSCIGFLKQLNYS